MFGKEGKRNIIFGLIFILGVGIAYQLITDNIDKQAIGNLPVYSPADLNPRLVDKSLQNSGGDFTTLPFSLINQYGDTITEAITENKITVVDFFFTTCGSICPKMTMNMFKVGEEMKGREDFVILSHTVFPQNDSAEVLLKYAQDYQATDLPWQFLTGSKDSIYKLARQSYFVVTDEPDTNGPDFIHTQNFVLVDKEHRLRGFYDGTNQKEIERLLGDINTLTKSYEK